MAGYSPLRDLITSVEYGTGLHVSVWWFVSIGSDLLSLDNEHIIHSSPFCHEAKRRPGGFARCMRCKKWANEKAVRTKEPFGGFCIHGIYEYCVPVVFDDQVVCVVYAGNSYPYPNQHRSNPYFFLSDVSPNVFDTQASPEDCKRAAEVVAGYLQLLLPFAGEKAASVDYIVQNVKSYAQINYMYEIPLAQLAEMFHYNEKYLGRVFKKTVGMSFRQYINYLRVERAKELLFATDSNILDVALMAGFNNVTYFNRIFREFEGCSPSEYLSR